MFKLLPEQTKKKVELEYRLRRTVVLLYASAVVLFVAIVSILPAYVLSDSKLNDARVDAAMSEQSATSAEIENLAVLAKDVRTKLAILSSARPGNAFEVFRDAIALAPEGIRLTSFRLMYKEEVGTLMLAGTAFDRQALLTFERALNASGKFEDSKLPVSQFAKDKDIDFTLTLTIATP